MVDPSSDFPRRDGSLPVGCKDLLDVLNLAGETSLEEAVVSQESGPQKVSGLVEDTPTKQVEVGEFIQVKTLANLLGCKPFHIISQLIKFHIFKANGDALLTFEEAEKVALQMGFEVRRLN